MLKTAFCPQIVFKDSVRFAKQTAIISLYIINYVVFVMEMQCGFCDVETQFFHIMF
jgi:hypothetical protein